MNTRVSTEDIDALAYAIEATSTDRTNFDLQEVLSWLRKNNKPAFHRLCVTDYFECCLWFV